MPLTQILGRLIACSIIEKKGGVLHFTPAFCRHVLKSQAKARSNSVESWREIVDSYNGSALNLSDQEITSIIVLLDYYLEKKSSHDDEIEI
jgi:hypothetical protein